VTDHPVIIDGLRLPIGRAFKGTLNGERPDDLGGTALRALLDEHPSLEETDIDEVIGCSANLVGEQSKNFGHIIARLAQIPETVAGVTVSRACASSLQGVRMAGHAVVAGEADVVAVVGVESTSRTYHLRLDPTTEGNPRFGPHEEQLGDMYVPMGVTAENVAERYDVSRSRMDEFALRSHELADQAWHDGYFDGEVIPYDTRTGNTLSKDESLRPGTTLEGLSQLEPRFRDGGRVTAGNSCPLNDGAGAVLVGSASYAAEHDLPVRARILGSATFGVPSEVMGIGPVGAVRRLNKRLDLSMEDYRHIELNEAFAAQVLAVCDELEVDPGRINAKGGAIALGHPFGLTGMRLVLTLVRQLEEAGGGRGLVTLCVGGGQGMALAVEV
jgi:acetyl-CoA C-acetyltransferase